MGGSLFKSSELSLWARRFFERALLSVSPNADFSRLKEKYGHAAVSWGGIWSTFPTAEIFGAIFDRAPFYQFTQTRISTFGCEMRRRFLVKNNAMRNVWTFWATRFLKGCLLSVYPNANFNSACEMRRLLRVQEKRYAKHLNISIGAIFRKGAFRQFPKRGLEGVHHADPSSRYLGISYDVTIWRAQIYVSPLSLFLF